MASLISKVVVWLAQSRIRVSSQRAWWCLDQVCSAIADFSVSPLLVAAWCSFKRVSSTFFIVIMVGIEEALLAMSDCQPRIPLCDYTSLTYREDSHV